MKLNSIILIWFKIKLNSIRLEINRFKIYLIKQDEKKQQKAMNSFYEKAAKKNERKIRLFFQYFSIKKNLLFRYIIVHFMQNFFISFHAPWHYKSRTFWRQVLEDFCEDNLPVILHHLHRPLLDLGNGCLQ